jgi:hypothetical protein
MRAQAVGVIGTAAHDPEVGQAMSRFAAKWTFGSGKKTRQSKKIGA